MDPDTADFRDVTLNDIRAWVPEAFSEALKQYPNDALGALVFFTNALGIGSVCPSDEDIEWAKLGRSP